jgi:LCP family protein required for cell wall assembly
MGLDSRLDENGHPLPPEIYQALHAGDQQVGGYNANVLMLVHLAGDGAKATAISIPRDDYVSLPGAPDGIAKGKIKQAYGFAFDQEHRKLVAAGVTDQSSLEQQSRDAGRREEVDTVAQLLGGVPIDHFVEVTMVAFYQLAQVVAPITVCLNEDTRDSYSGADFHRGYQQINAAQAVAFVRQRRDNVHPQLNFSDLDRERRQQAFIASLVYQLKQAGTFLNPVRLRELITVAKQNIAADTGLELLSFAQQASALTGGNITFTTLPIVRFGRDPAGEDVNIVDVPEIQALVHNLIGPRAPTPPSPPSPAPGSGGRQSGTVDVVNATSRNGLAAALEHALITTGFIPGVTSNARHHLSTSMIYYPDAGSAQAANTLAAMLGGLPAELDSTVPTGHLRVILGADYTMPATLGTPTTSDSSATTSTPPAPAGPHRNDAEPADPTSVSGAGIPCVT